MAASALSELGSQITAWRDFPILHSSGEESALPTVRLSKIIGYLIDNT